MTIPNIKKLIRKKKHPRFFRDKHVGFTKKLEDVWRKPRGIDNKKRKQRVSHGAMVRIGYGTNKIVKGLHPSGAPEVLVHNVAEVEKIVGKIGRIASGVGAKKRNEIRLAAGKIGVKLVN